MISGPLMEMKFAFDSVATAFASNVFPVPGGPYKRIPFAGLMPMRLKESPLSIGISTISFSWVLTSSKPPTSSQVVG